MPIITALLSLQTVKWIHNSRHIGYGAAVSQSNMKITLTNNDVKAVEPPNNTGKESSGGSMGYSVLLLGALIYARKKHAAYNGNTK